MKPSGPFRYDIVGSFLRPDYLKQAREDYEANKITKDQLQEVEDEAIKELVKQQQKIGLKAVTDGEFRRKYWHFDFISELNGITTYQYDTGGSFNGAMGKMDAYYVSGELSFNPHHSFLNHFKFMKSIAGDSVVKQTIPGPNMILNSGVISSAYYRESPYYKNLDEVIEAIAKTYQEAILAFYQAGCRYLQLDDTAWGTLFNPKSIEAFEALGYTIPELCEKFTKVTQKSLENRPQDMTITIHVCRGNFKSNWLYEGTYDNIASALFEKVDVDGFFLEFDDERSGSFEPLQKVSGDKIVVLGLITSKTPTLEDEEFIINRIKEASQYIPLERLCLSPQCGFASTQEGNTLTSTEQWEKVKLVKRISEKVWG